MMRNKKTNSLELVNLLKVDGGGIGIRTLGGRKPSPVFKTGAFNHSTIPP